MQQRRLAAIMFTDIVGYTSIMSKNEKEALHAIQKVRDILKPLIEDHNGKWQKEIGDGTLSSFSSAVDAVSCALAFQRSIGNASFKIRIGIHVGEVTMTDDDIFGDGVNIASRIEPLAPPGGIYITDRVYEDVSNKPEIKTALVGTRSLKNVERPIQIYTLIGEGLPEPPKKPVSNNISNFFKDLWGRRMPQITVLYLLISFLIIQIVQWVINKLMLSPNWFDLTWILLLSFLPSIIFMAYYHGKSGRDKWLKKEKIFVSANLAVSILILVFLFHGKDLGATTMEVTVEDEQGNTIQRIVPKNEFIKSIAVFNFENHSDPEELGWLSSGISIALTADLGQDIFFQPKGTESFIDELKRAKVEHLGLVPFSLQRSIAKEFGMDYFVAGSYDRKQNGYQVNTQLYEVENGKLITEHTVEGLNIFNLVDQITVKIKEDLQLPKAYIESAEDLPISSILTSNQSAFKDFTKGAELANFDKDFDGSIQYFHKALEKEPDFIFANFNLALVYLMSNKMEQTSKYIDIVMDKIYMLPDRDQFLAKSFYYLIHKDHEKRVNVFKMWIELYPDDIDAHYMLSQIHYYEGEHAKAVAVLKSALEIDDNRGNFYVFLADILKAQGKNEEALSYYQLYAEHYPDQARSFRLLGDYYFDEGAFDEAKRNYEKSLLLSRNNISSLGKLAMIKERQGLFEEAERDYNSAMEHAGTSGDSLKIYTMQINYNLHRGRIQKVIDLWEQSLITSKNENPPLVVSIARVTRLYWYFLAHQSDRAFEIINQEKGNFSGGFQNILSHGYINYYIHQKDIGKAEDELKKIRQFVKEYGSAGSIDIFYEGEISFLKEDYSSALTFFLEFKAVNIHFSEDLLDSKIALTYMNMGDMDGAKNTLNDMLKFNPYQASAHLLLAKILIEEGNEQEAKEHLIIGNQVWENADDAYDPAREARELLENLEKI